MSSLAEKHGLNSQSSSIQMPGDCVKSGEGGDHGQSSEDNGGAVIYHSTTLLPTQVGIDQSGTVHTDFPFDGKELSLKQKWAMSGNTLLPPKK